MRKKISIPLFGLIVSFSFLNAQVKPSDSLYNLLALHMQEDTVRVNLLNNLAYEYRRAKPAAADSLIKLAIELADKINYTKGKGYAVAIEGARYYAKLAKRKAFSRLFSAVCNCLSFVSKAIWACFLSNSKLAWSIAVFCAISFPVRLSL